MMQLSLSQHKWLIAGLIGFFALVIAQAGCSASSEITNTGQSSETSSSLETYTWEELSQISSQIAAASSDEEALNIAQQNGLLNDEGKLDGTQTKTLELSDGTLSSVQIIGFAHDTKADGSKAGITFMFTQAIESMEMNAAPYGSSAEDDGNDQLSNEGGWQSCDLRSWLSSDGLAMLPDDLQALIVPVEKLTNNTGKTRKTSSVTSTSDTLWLPSYVELSGKLDGSEWNGQAANGLDTFSEAAAIFNAEGTQYQLYSDAGVDGTAQNEILVKTAAKDLKYYSAGDACYWWQRTPFSNYGTDFMRVNSLGKALGSVHSDYEFGVVPCFCI